MKLKHLQAWEEQKRIKDEQKNIEITFY